VWSYVVAHPPLLADYASQAPYVVVVVELADAPRIRLVGNLVERAGDPIGALPPERVRIGAAVRVVFGDGGMPRWVLEGP
jgi:uncharacterized OB-fold protein